MKVWTARVFIVAAVLVGTTHARAETKKRVCVEAYEHAQELRMRGRLRASHAELLVCAQTQCPELARRDCIKWLREVEDATPTVIVKAHDGDGNDLAEVRVSLDSSPLLDRLDGNPTPVDPGEHAVRFEHGSDPATEQKLVIAAGEKNRIVSVVFGQAPAAKPKAPAQGAERQPTAARPSAIPAGVFVLGAMGLLSAGLSTYFEIKGIGDRQHLLDTCAGRCPPSDVDFAYRELRAGDVLGAVALASLGAAALWFYSSRTNGAPTSTVGLTGRYLRGGGTAALSLPF